MTRPQDQSVKAGPQLGSQIEFFNVRTSLDIQPGLLTASQIAAAHAAMVPTPVAGSDASEVDKETAGQKRLDLIVAAISTFAQPLMLKLTAIGAADGNGDTQGVTFGFEHVGAATALKLSDAIAAALVAYGDASTLSAATALITVVAL